MTAAAVFACPACQAPLSAGARYCHRCGRALSATSARERRIWTGAWAVVVLVLAMIVYFVNRDDPTSAVPDMANAGNAASGAERPSNPSAPPDISQMDPRERFLRLHDRIMAAGDSGDAATAQRFLPMALAAYTMIEQVDVDLRYHAGALQVRAGNFPAALALADTIMSLSPDNLLGDLLRLEVAQDRADSAAIKIQTQQYLTHFDRQMASGRPEYTEHRTMLDDLRRQLQPR